MKSVATIKRSPLKVSAEADKDVVAATLSAAALLKDAAYPERGIVGSVDFALVSTDQNRVIRRQPANKTNGLFVYSDIAPGKYLLKVASEFYFEATAAVSITNDPSTEFKPVEIMLYPKPYYPYPSGATLLSGAVKSGISPLGGVRIEATYKLEAQGPVGIIERAAQTWTVESGPYQGLYTLSFNAGESSRPRAIEAALSLSKEGYKNKQERLTLPARQVTNRVFTMEAR